MLLTRFWNKSQSKEKAKKLLDHQLIPDHGLLLEIPRVNPEIFASLTQQSKGHDVKLERQEKILVKTAVPITKVIDYQMQIEIGRTM